MKNDRDLLFKDSTKLFGYSFLILFFELALIRFIPSNVRITAYFINLVLIAAFLGMGIGILQSKRERNLTLLFPPCLLLLVGACIYFSNVLVVAPQSEEAFFSIYYDLSPKSKKWGMVPVVSLFFFLGTFPFISLGYGMGREFQKFPPLKAYAINTAGGIAGLFSFSLLSLFSLPPIVWFLFGGFIFLLLAGREQNYFISIVCMGLTLYLVQNLYEKDHEIWSPYYKINHYETPFYTALNVNGSLHQNMINFSPSGENFRQHTELLKKDFQLPFQFAKKWDDVLILGAGTGNDVHMALEQKPKNIDAVEIDPEILKFGKENNYQKPYDDPRVTVHIDDGRAFLKKTKKKYDVIIFGTLDSQTLLSGKSSIRLDNYIYTLEAFRSAKEHLKPEGIVILYHMSHYFLISFKIAKLLKEVFEIHPLIRFEKNHRLFNFTFVAGAEAERYNEFGYTFPGLISQTEKNNALGYKVPNLIKDNETLFNNILSPTDDWPYLYLDKPGIPKHYLQVGGIIFLISLFSIIFSTKGANIKKPDWTLFLFGASFLLLETKSVTEMSLLFGSTWQVNVLVFGAILVIIFVANLLIFYKGPFDKTKLFFALFLSIGVGYGIPAHNVLSLPLAGQWLIGALITAVPLFFAGLLFSQIFKYRKEPTLSLVYNLMGAICGGLFEYSSMFFGTKYLSILALVIYILTFLVHGREESPG